MRTLLLLLLLHLAHSRELFQAFANKYSQRSVNLSQKLPTIPNVKSVREEMDDYEQKQASVLFRDFMGDPALNVNILLGKGQRRSQVLLMGRQLSRLAVSVVLQIRQARREPQVTFVGVFVYNCETNELVYSSTVLNAILFEIPLESGLYSIVVAEESQFSEPGVERQEAIIVHILMDVVDDQALVEQRKAASSMARKGVLLMENIAALAASYDRVFSESISTWGTVEDHREQHFANLNDMQIRSYLEIAIVSLINLLQAVLLWKAMSGRGVV